MTLINFLFMPNEWWFQYKDNNELKEITFYNINDAEDFNIFNNLGLILHGCKNCDN